MPLDRRITIQTFKGTRGNDGEYNGTWSDHAHVWADRRGAGSTDVETTGGIRVNEVVTWTIRYTADLAALGPDETRVVDSSGRMWSVSGIAESDHRRRFLVIETVRQS